MELRYAAISVHKPVIFAVVGLGKKWKSSEVWCNNAL